MPFFRVVHESFGQFPQGHVLDDEGLPTVDFERAVRLGAVAPINDDVAKHLIETGQSPPPTVLPPLPPRMNEREFAAQMGRMFGMMANAGGLGGRPEPVPATKTTGADHPPLTGKEAETEPAPEQVGQTEQDAKSAAAKPAAHPHRKP